MQLTDLTVKYETAESVHRNHDQLTIWQTPQGSLYQVRSRSGLHVVETLVSTGWIQLITLSCKAAGTANDAMSIWLDVQDTGNIQGIGDTQDTEERA
ncbi:hypothetical protein [Arthrobacter castelli]|uniref:hypothetical protein n=1 Tax=Arthrobacter castelli TaxID=271431 RepID=UPI0003FA3ACE|nr:hypothetical protein [Arthrobacter castelli]